MTDSASYVFNIQEDMTIYTAANIREKLLLELEKEGDMEIDLSGVTEFDSTGYQLLLACKCESKTGDKVIKITNPSSVVSEVLHLYRDTETVSQD